jgi:hypothetical protein
MYLLARPLKADDFPSDPAICQDFIFPALSPKADQHNINMADNRQVNAEIELNDASGGSHIRRRKGTHSRRKKLQGNAQQYPHEEFPASLCDVHIDLTVISSGRVACFLFVGLRTKSVNRR